MHTLYASLLACVFVVQLGLVAGSVKIVLQAYDAKGNPILSPHDAGNGNAAKIKCTFPSYATLPNYFPVEIKIVTITDKNKEIYQAVCHQILSRYMISEDKKNKYKGVGLSLAYSKHCDHDSLEYQVRVSSDLPKNFRCDHTSPRSVQYVMYFMYAPTNVTITREPSSPITAESQVTFLCTASKSKPAALLKFVLDTELNSSIVEHIPSMKSVMDSYQLTSSTAEQSETELRWETKAHAKYNGKILKCLGEHPASGEGSLAAEVKIDWTNGKESGAATQASPKKLEGKGRSTLSAPVIAVIAVLGVAVASVIGTTLYMTFKKRKVKKKKASSSAAIGRPASTITRLSSKSSKSSRSSRSKRSKRKH